MPISKARHKANEKYNAKAYDEIKVRVGKGQKEVMQKAITERMERQAAGDSTGAGDSYGISEPESGGNCDSRFTSPEPPHSNSGHKQESAAMSKEEWNKALGLDPESSRLIGRGRADLR